VPDQAAGKTATTIGQCQDVDAMMPSCSRGPVRRMAEQTNPALLRELDLHPAAASAAEIVSPASRCSRSHVIRIGAVPPAATIRAQRIKAIARAGRPAPADGLCREHPSQFASRCRPQAPVTTSHDGRAFGAGSAASAAVPAARGLAERQVARFSPALTLKFPGRKFNHVSPHCPGRQFAASCLVPQGQWSSHCRGRLTLPAASIPE